MLVHVTNEVLKVCLSGSLYKVGPLIYTDMHSSQDCHLVFLLLEN